jgi:AdoMet-dependent rRNA methyltransferase SPB1
MLASINTICQTWKLTYPPGNFPTNFILNKIRFVENEKRHIYKAIPVTKDEIKAEKERLREFKDRPSKKVMEAQFRKKKKRMAELKRFKNKADEIFEQTGLDEKSKVREVGKAFAHAQRKIKKTKEKQIITGKKHMSGCGGSTTGRKFRMVDARGKKDLRAEKRAERKKRGVKPNATKKKWNRR